MAVIRNSATAQSFQGVNFGGTRFDTNQNRGLEDERKVWLG